MTVEGDVGWTAFGVEKMSLKSKPEIPESVVQFQEQLRESKPLWNRNILTVFLPGFLLFGWGGPLGLLTPTGKPHDIRWMIYAGIALCVVGAVRGAIIASRYWRCPVCNRFQSPQWRIPYRSCLGCGARLSMGIKDSS